VAYLGPGSAGHFVKMVHNGIEYAAMRLIADTYDLMKRGLHLNDDELHDVYTAWNREELNSYLIEITAHIFRQIDPITGQRLIDEILDVAKQKGTGMWTSQSAMELQVPIPTIDLAVAMRNLSALEEQRHRVSAVLVRPIPPFAGDRDAFLTELRHALYAAMIIAYTQGLAVLATASDRHAYHLDLEAVARIWRGGCIIRAVLLEEIRAAYRTQPTLPNLLFDRELSQKVMANQEALRRVVCAAAEWGVPAPGMMTALAYLDGYRSAWLPANLIQAQRDYFGAHTYERIDAKGTFHTEWQKG
jgi:6-phosphogluconate dehydrogenase